MAEPRTRQLTHRQVNYLVRVTLLVVGLLAFGFTLVAAHPAYRYFGKYTGVVGTRQAIIADGNVPGAYVTVSHPSVVTFPEDWKQADQLCMVIELTRGQVPPAVPFDDYPPQIQWDRPPEDAVLFSGDDLTGRAADGSVMLINNNQVKPLISARLPFRVNWIGQDSVPVYADRPVGGLLCVTFSLDDQVRVAPLTYLIFKVKNLNIERAPAFYFQYGDIPGAISAPPETVRIERRAINDYLTELASQAPVAVQPGPAK